jgi:hypothetical protein
LCNSVAGVPASVLQGCSKGQYARLLKAFNGNTSFIYADETITGCVPSFDFFGKYAVCYFKRNIWHRHCEGSEAIHTVHIFRIGFAELVNSVASGSAFAMTMHECCV